MTCPLPHRFVSCCAILLAGLHGQEPEQVPQLLTHYPDNDLPALFDGMKSADAAKAQEATETVAKVGRPAHPYLVGLMLSSSGRKAQHIGIALKGFDQQDAWAVPVLMEMLHGQFLPYRREAVQLLSQLGSCARPALPSLEACLADPKRRSLHADVRQAITSIKEAKQAVATDAGNNKSKVGFRFRDGDTDWLVKIAAAGGDNAWPAIQALEALGDAALVRLLPAILEATASADGAQRQQLDQLRAMIRYEALSRMIHDTVTLNALSGEDLERELTTICLAGGGRGFVLTSWLRTMIHGSNPRLRALALMAVAQSPRNFLSLTTSQARMPEPQDPVIRRQVRAAHALLCSNERRRNEQMVARALKELESGNPAAVSRAISSLTIVGPDALPAADHVIKAYRQGDPKTQHAAHVVLQQMGPKVASKLLAAFDVNDPKDARKLLPVLGVLRPPTREIVYAMLDCFGHADKGVQDLAKRFFFRPDAAPHLCAALLDDKRRETALLFLYQRTDPSWRPQLLKALPSLQAAAQKVKGDAQRKLLGVMALCGPTIVPFVQELLASTDDDERLAALTALRRLGTQGLRALDDVIACLQDKNAKVQTQAIWTLGRIDAQNDKIVKALVAAFDGAGPDVRVALLRTIGSKGPRATTGAAPLLDRLMKGKDLALKYHAAGVMALLRPDDPRPVEMCRKGLTDYKGDELWAVAHVIATYTSVTRKLVPEMAALLKSDHAQVRMNAIIALRWLGTDAKAALPALREIAKSGTKEERRSAAHAIRRIFGRR